VGASKKPQCCGTCRWAKWSMTKGDPPRIKRDAAVHCDWPFIAPVIPQAARFSYDVHYVTEKYGTECPVWEVASAD